MTSNWPVTSWRLTRSGPLSGRGRRVRHPAAGRAGRGAIQLEAVRAAIGPRGGASAFEGKLVCRIAAPDGLALRRVLLPAIAALSGGRPAPSVWTL